ncbi:MAG TPA: hypothetical protein VLD16_12325 [Gaiellaceae bacterium]|nr:hypothetical protein [Gaiellaceae bacterium]
MRKRPGVIGLFVLIAVAGFASTLALGSARGGLLPSVTVPTLPISLPVTTAPLPPAPPPPAPPAPPPSLPPAPPPPALPPVPSLAPPPPLPQPVTQTPPVASPAAPSTAGSATSAGPAAAPAATSRRHARAAADAPHVSRARFHTHGPGRRGTTITFRLAAPATVVLLVRGPSPSCDLAGRRVVTLGKGVSRVRFLGRFHGRPLVPGTYGITMVARRAGSSSLLGRLAVTVVPPGERIRRASAPPSFVCGKAASASSSTPFAALGLILPTGAKNVRAKVTVDLPQPSFRPPTLSVPVPRAPVVPGLSSLGPAWLGVLFYAVLLLASAALVLLVVSFFRERWNP